MQQAFLDNLKKRKLCTSSDKILLAVSGGIDSMVLLDLFLKSGFDVSVAHVNFKLRGIESDKDENFVRDKCKLKSVPFFTTSFDTEAFARENKLSIQMAARELRYGWFEQIISEHDFDYLATAHHLNDSIETAILNMVRGSGLEGWDGISVANGKIIRPLLFAAREQIQNYAAENSITWREDESNSTDHYQRNFIRHQVVPLLSQLNPSFENSFSDSMEKISAAIELMELGMTEWKKAFTSEKDDSIYILKEGFVQSDFPEGLLWNLLRDFGFNFDQCTQAIQTLDGQPGKSFYAGEYQLSIDRTHLILSFRKEGIEQVFVEDGQTDATLAGRTLKLRMVDLSEVTKEKEVAFLDADKIKFPLIWRRWADGDNFFPLGMNHKKKISDFLIDQKIPVSQKDTVTVLESNGEITWVVGMRIGDPFKVTENTRSVLRIALSQ